MKAAFRIEALKERPMTDEVLPPGVELLESMRSVGYSFEDAIADLVDNSITAKARRVDVVGDPIHGEYVAVIDDGEGMPPEGARTALRLAGSATGARHPDDLGRFGLGLKTASLSQARKLTLYTKQNGKNTLVQWDIDHVKTTGEWRIKVLEPRHLAHIPEAAKFSSLQNGTLVLWENLDHLIGDDAHPAETMAEKLSGLRDHLALVFHQFLDKQYVGGLQISVNRVMIEPVDPFVISHPQTQRSPIEKMRIDDHAVELQSYILPHATALRSSDIRRPDLMEKMRQEQGFYVYRAHRLIDWGSWYGVVRTNELSKQARVRVEFPNALDHLWQIDIRKSRVRPPRRFLRQYQNLLLNEVQKSEKIHKYRGRRRKGDSDYVPLWNVVDDRFTVRFEINTDHPLVKSSLDGLPTRQQLAITRLLKDLGSSMPGQSAYVELASNKQQVEPDYTEDEIVQRINALLELGVLATKRDLAVAQLRSMEPFNATKNIEELLDRAEVNFDD